MNFLQRIINWFRPPTPKPPVKPPTPTPTPTPSPVPGENIKAQLLAAHNVARNARGRPTFNWSTKLEADAFGHATLMARLHIMSHTLPGEPNMGDRLTARGYLWSWAAENIAASYNDVSSVMRGWLNSQGHLENIVGPSTEMGAAMVIGTDGKKYWSVTFGRPAVGVEAVTEEAPRLFAPFINYSENAKTSSMYMSLKSGNQ